MKKKDKPVILYLDDDKENLIGFEASFSKEYKIITTTDTSSAYNLLRKNKIQIALVDYRLKNGDGITFIEQIKDEFPELVFIIVTAYIEIEAILEAMDKLNIHGYAQKPWNHNCLRVIIKNAEETHRIKALNSKLIQELQQMQARLSP